MRVVWSPVAERRLIALPGDDADAIYAAMERFASGGPGFERDMLDGTRALYMARHVVFFTVEGEVMIVLTVRARRR